MDGKTPPGESCDWEESSSESAAVEREKELETDFGKKWLEREIEAGRTRQTGEPASVLLELFGRSGTAARSRHYDPHVNQERLDHRRHNYEGPFDDVYCFLERRESSFKETEKGDNLKVYDKRRIGTKT